MPKEQRSPCTRPCKLQNVLTAAPLDIVAIDILSGLPIANDGNTHILVITDYFTKWSEAYPLPDSEVSTCMTALYNNFFSRFGLPRQLHSYQGKNFESKLFSELCNITGIDKSRTTPFHPRSDGMNRTLLQMLRTTASDHANNWPAYLPSIISAYRMTVHSITGMTPNFAMLGREVLMPATLTAQPPDEPNSPTVPYVVSFRQTLRNAHNQIRQTTNSVAKVQKTYFDKHIRGSAFAVHQLVWLYWPRPPIRQQKKKLQRLWTGPWQIISFITPLVVKIRHVTNNKTHTVHIDRLSPCRNQSETPDQLAPTTSAPAITTPTTPPSSEHQSSVPPPATTPVCTSTRTKRPPKYLQSYTAV